MLLFLMGWLSIGRTFLNYINNVVDKYLVFAGSSAVAAFAASASAVAVAAAACVSAETAFFAVLRTYSVAEHHMLEPKAVQVLLK